MADLIATPAFGTDLPVTTDGVVARATSYEAITSVAPFRGQEDAVSAALAAQVGAGLPAPNRAEGSATARVVWFGIGQVFVLGPKVAPIAVAALTDQTDGWAGIALEGPSARDVLARLVPADLRGHVFAPGHVMRSPLGHMNALILRTGADAYEVMVFRSMAGTAVHDLATAMHAVAARLRD